MFGITKHHFDLYCPGGNPNMEQVKKCIDICTMDGSEVVKMKISYHWVGSIYIVKIWTKTPCRQHHIARPQ